MLPAYISDLYADTPFDESNVYILCRDWTSMDDKGFYTIGACGRVTILHDDKEYRVTSYNDLFELVKKYKL